MQEKFYYYIIRDLSKKKHIYYSKVDSLTILEVILFLIVLGYLKSFRTLKHYTKWVGFFTIIKAACFFHVVKKHVLKGLFSFSLLKKHFC